MATAYRADTRVLVTLKASYAECICIPVSGREGVELQQGVGGPDVIFDYQMFHKRYDGILADDQPDPEDIAFVLINPNGKDKESQIVGVAKLDAFYEDQPGTVYLFS